MTICMIAAVGKNLELGKDNNLISAESPSTAQEHNHHQKRRLQGGGCNRCSFNQRGT